jgi:hypothetical protein
MYFYRLRKRPRLVALAAVVLLTVVHQHVCQVTALSASLQSGPDLSGSTFPAAIAYDQNTHSVIIIGSTYGRFFSGVDVSVEVPRHSSDCFMARVTLPSVVNPELEWTVRKTMGDKQDAVQESCSSMVFHERNTKLIVAGHSERGGFMDGLYDDSLIQQATKYGILLDYDVNNGSESQGDGFTLKGGRVLQASKVTYPLALTSGVTDQWIYVASQETDSLEEAADGNHVGGTFSVSDEVDPMRFLKYIGKYRLAIARYQVQNSAASTPVQNTFVPGWTQIYAAKDAPVHIGGITEIGDLLIVVGTTNATSAIFGGADPILQPGSLHGFVSKFDKSTGKVSQGLPSRAIQSQGHDYIAGVCRDKLDFDHVYIVGATQGDLSQGGQSKAPTENSHAFIMKFDVNVMAPVWTRQFEATPAKGSTTSQTRGVSCAADGAFVWIGGVAQDGAVITGSWLDKSYGDDDVFVAKVATGDGNVALVRQIGSADDDSLSMRGGLVLDKNGNCVVVGSTFGSLFRVRSSKELEDEPWISDVFVTIIDGNGDMVLPVSDPGVRPFTAGEQAPHVGAPVQNNNGESVPVQRPESSRWTLIVVCVMLVITLAFFASSQRAINRDVQTVRSSVTPYLNEFDVDDIDLKHSATGGWHCSYSNALASGINKRVPRSFGTSFADPLATHDPLMTERLKDSVLLRDSLFMDDSPTRGSALAHGRDGRAEVSTGSPPPEHRRGYESLIQAYNESWEERRRQIGSGWGKDIV